MSDRLNMRVRWLMLSWFAVASCLPVAGCKDTAADHHERGLALFKHGQYDEAIAEFTVTLEMDSWLAIAYYNRGLAYDRKGDYARAIADFTEYLRIYTDDVKAYGARAWAYCQGRDYDRALADCNRVRKRDPRNHRAYLGRVAGVPGRASRSVRPAGIEPGGKGGWPGVRIRRDCRSFGAGGWQRQAAAWRWGTSLLRVALYEPRALSHRQVLRT